MDIALFVDNTALLRARVKAIKLRQASSSKQRIRTNSSSPEPQEDENRVDQSRSQTPSVEEEEQNSATASPNFRLYTAHARQICQHIRELADLVVERRKFYLLTSVNVYGHDNFMTDDDRRQFDADTDLAMKQCSRLVRNLEFQIDNDSSLRSDDEYAHMKAVNLLLNVYLKNVCKIVAELRAVHLKKTQYLNRICRLGNLVSMCGSKLDAQRIERQNPKTSREVLSKPNQDNEDAEKNDRALRVERSNNIHQKHEEESCMTAPDYQDEEDLTQAQDNELNRNEQAQLLVENKHLFERLIQRNSEIEQIETQFAELQKLQQTFIEKVVEQEKDIEVIHDKTVHTLDNLDQANEFIREAIKNSASRRVIALFCLIVLTLTLLFLDWYNP